MKRGVVYLLVAIFGLLLAAELALVVAMSTSSGTDSAVRNAVYATRGFLLGDDDSRGVFARAASSTGRAASDLVAILRGADNSRREGNDKFTRCMRCHDDYASKQRFPTTYLDHAQHAEIGLTCEQCHTDTAHPDPEPPHEKVCAECHKEVDQRKKCDTCHPPGSLPHFYKDGFPRKGSVRCDSCHKRSAFAGGGVALPTVDRSDAATCESCHEQQKCASCHGTHPADWVLTHGRAYGEGDPSCGECHDTSICATRCHADRSIMDRLTGA